MSIHVHKTGLNKTLGQQSDAIVTASLVGDFQPSQGIGTASYWDNQVSSGKNLRRFNSITHNNSTPHNFQFDGTDDYLGAASTGYGGDPFTIDITNAFTICQWVKYNDANHYVFYVSIDGSNYISLNLNAGTADKATISTYTSSGNGDSAFSSFTFADDTWYYVSLVHDGSGNYSLFVNGSYIGTADLEAATGGAGNLVIGKYGGSYSASGTKIGHVHVYTAALTNSQLRQNFLASHVINNTRVYGATYAA